MDTRNLEESKVGVQILLYLLSSKEYNIYIKWTPKFCNEPI